MGIRLAIEQFDETGWTGGVGYIQNLVRSFSSLDTADRPYTILTRRQGTKPYAAAVDQFLEVPIEPVPPIGTRVYNKIAQRAGLAISSPPPIIKSLLAQHKAEVLFTHKIYPSPMGLPLIGWIPDFQYIHLPEIAGAEHAAAIAKYHHGLIRQSAALLVSSHDVLKDLKAFSPAAGETAHVVQFVAYIPEEVYNSDPAVMCQKYSLPQRYFFCPNQFWKHKNHLLVIQALQILKNRGVDLTVVCTGTTFDERNPNFFSSVLTQTALAGVHDRFRILGLVDRQDVYHLQRQALALLQPSLFEGWSTSIEEAKSLGKRVVASDLAVNIEQIPEADFFARHDAQSLASVLEKVSQSTSPGPDLAREAQARAQFPARVKEFATKFTRVITQVRSKGVASLFDRRTTQTV